MAVSKNTAAKAEEKPKGVTKAKAAPANAVTKAVPAAKAPIAKAAAKVAVAKAEAPEKEVVRLGRKELAAGIRDHIMIAGGAISPKVAEQAITALEDTITTALAAGSEVVLPGFGKFVTSFREARQGHNPQTGEAVEIAAKTVPVFKAGGKLKAAVNGETEAEAE